MGEAKTRRVARVSSMRFEASFGRASEGKYESRLTMARRYDIDCVDRNVRSFRSTKSVSESNQRNG